MKGNHNKDIPNIYWVIVVINMSKIQNERKSQHNIDNKKGNTSCN